MKYLHKYKNLDDFKTDYNGEYYHEPWVSTNPKEDIVECDLYGDGYHDTLKLIGPGTVFFDNDGEIEEISAYIWDLSPQGDPSKFALPTDTIEVGTKWLGISIGQDGKPYVTDNFENTSSHVYQIFNVSSTGNRVTYNKRPGMPEITYDMGFGDGPTVTCDNLGTLTCESLEDTAVTYPVLVHVLNSPYAESESEQDFDFVGTLRFNYVAHESWGDVYYWRVYNDYGNDTEVQCYCNDGTPYFFITE